MHKFIRVVNFSKIKIYPILKNSWNTIYKGFPNRSWIFFSEKFIQNARVEKKLSIRVLPGAHKADRLAYSIVSLFYCIVLYNL